MNRTNQYPQYPGWTTVRKLGSGSFGTVYEIERNLLGTKERAALKWITLPQSESEVEEFFNSGYDKKTISAHYESCLTNVVGEYRLMAELRGQSNIVNCDDILYVPKDDGIGWDIFIRMELLTPLPKALELRPDEQQVIRVAEDMCRALILCAKHKTVHRDIKPGNIFASDDGDFKLGDFGVARTMENTTMGTRTGTFRYMAPEVYNNQPYGQRADLYSLGMVLYWLLNERCLPFLPLPPQIPTAQEEELARAKRIGGVPIPPPLYGSAWLKKIVLKACAFDPEARYHSAEEMLWDLEHHSAPREDAAPIWDWDADTEPVPEPTPPPPRPTPTPRPDPVVYPAPKPANRKKLIATAAVAAVLVLALGLGIGAALHRDESTESVVSWVTPVPVEGTATTAVPTPSGGSQQSPTEQPAEQTQTAASAESGSVPTVAPTPAPTVAPTPAPTAVPEVPKEEDLRALQNDPAYPNNIAFPKAGSYLPAYETMYVKSSKGVGINLYWDASGDTSHLRSHFVPEGKEVTVLARENGFSCIIFKNDSGHMISGWVSSNWLVYGN